MSSLVEAFDQKLDLVRLELSESRLLPQTYKKALQAFIGGKWSEDDLYFNNSCLITTNKSDAELILSQTGCEELFTLSSTHFEFAFHFISIIENKKLFNLIGGVNG